MLLLVWAYKPSSWATVAVGGCDNICFLLASQYYGSVCLYTYVHICTLSPLTVLHTERAGYWPSLLAMINILITSRYTHFLGGLWGCLASNILANKKKKQIIFIISTLLLLYKWIVSSPHKKVSRENYCFAWGAFLPYLCEKPVPISLP